MPICRAFLTRNKRSTKLTPSVWRSPTRPRDAKRAIAIPAPPRYHDRTGAAPGKERSVPSLLNLHGPIAHWLHHWGYLAVFCGVMLENAGIPVPGETIVLAATALAARGQLNVALLYPAAVAGAITGDNLGYWVGRTLGRHVLRRVARAIGLEASKFDDAERQFQRNGVWAVFLGRFVALLRTLAGPLAGAVEMPWPRFFVFNASGAVLWVAVVMALGYLFGTEIDVVLRHAGLALGVVVLAAGGWLLFRYLRRTDHAPLD